MRTVLVFGDSNSHGTMPLRFLGDVQRYPAEVRWTGHARPLLPEGTVLIEEGHPGRTTLHDDPVEGAHKNGLAVLPAILESHRPIDLVVLMLGTNDVKARFAVTAADVARSVERLAQVVIASGAGPEQGAPGVLIVAPPPVEERGCLAGFYEGGAAKSRQVGALLAGIAEARGWPFVDAGAHLAVSAVDGVHFEAEGHAALGRAVGAAIRAALD